MRHQPLYEWGHKWGHFMARLTEVQLKALRAADDGARLSDGDGVFGVIYAKADGDVSVRFTMRYKAGGKSRDVRLGTWPKVSLRAMREERDRVRTEIKDRIDPLERRLAGRLKDQVEIAEAQRRIAEEAAQRQIERERNLPLRDLFDAWLSNGTARKDGGAELRRAFSKDILPALGDKPVRAITSDDLRAALSAVGQDRGRGRLAVLLLRDLKQMFRWATDEQPWRRLLAEGDPTKRILVDKIVSSDYDVTNIRRRILSADEIRELRATFRQMQADYEAAKNRRTASRPVSQETQIALWLCLSTCCRIGELLSARWDHVDLARCEWVIPRENYKRQRDDKRPDFLVGLSGFAVRQFEALRKITGKSEWCFPSSNGTTHVCVKSVSKQVGDRQTSFKNRTRPLKGRRNDDSLILGAGNGGEWTAHDLRRTGSTLMQSLKVRETIRNLCLNHTVGTRIDQAYGVHEFADEKREAWAQLGARLEAILADNVVIMPVRDAA